MKNRTWLLIVAAVAAWLAWRSWFQPVSFEGTWVEDKVDVSGERSQTPVRLVVDGKRFRHEFRERGSADMDRILLFDGSILHEVTTIHLPNKLFVRGYHFSQAEFGGSVANRFWLQKVLFPVDLDTVEDIRGRAAALMAKSHHDPKRGVIAKAWVDKKTGMVLQIEEQTNDPVTGFVTWRSSLKCLSLRFGPPNPDDFSVEKLIAFSKEPVAAKSGRPREGMADTKEKQ